MGKRGPMAGVPVAERFWSKVNKQGPKQPHMKTRCWLWLRSTFKAGYGQFKNGSRNMKAHRMAWELTYGEVVPSTVVVRHHCDVRLCVRPGHLAKGTVQDNWDDCVRRGRSPHGRRNGRAKLTVADVMQIRQYVRDTVDVRKLMKRYRVSETTIWNVIKHVTWQRFSEKETL